MIVLHNIALETLAIFAALYKHKFPIESMVLPSSFKSTNDWASTEADNTVGYFCRKDEQTPNQFSPHSYGIAVDINPRYNPAAVAQNKIQPKSGRMYMSRELKQQGMIKLNSFIMKLFTHYGWKWGGFWNKSDVDYMHFQKDMNRRYTCTNLIFTDLHMHSKPNSTIKTGIK